MVVDAIAQIIYIAFFIIGLGISLMLIGGTLKLGAILVERHFDRMDSDFWDRTK